jgi:hypothetical protein
VIASLTTFYESHPTPKNINKAGITGKLEVKFLYAEDGLSLICGLIATLILVMVMRLLHKMTIKVRVG